MLKCAVCILIFAVICSVCNALPGYQWQNSSSVSIDNVNNTFMADGILYCLPRFANSGAIYVENKIINDRIVVPWTQAPSLSSGTCNSSVALSLCSQHLHSVPLFAEALGPAQDFMCVCERGFYRAGDGDRCVACGGQHICPEFSNQRYTCPPLMTLASHDCVALQAGHSQLNVQTSGSFIFSHSTEQDIPLYVFTPIRACHYTQQREGLTCTCRRGYFTQDALGAQCSPCEAGDFCRGGVSPAVACGHGLSSPSAAGGPEECTARQGAIAEACTGVTPGRHHSNLPLCVTAICPPRFYCPGSANGLGIKIQCPPGANTMSGGETHAGACFCQTGLEWVAIKHSTSGFGCVVRKTPEAHRELVNAPTTEQIYFEHKTMSIAWTPTSQEGREVILHAVLSLTNQEFALDLHLAREGGAHRTARTNFESPVQVHAFSQMVEAFSAPNQMLGGYDAVVYIASRDTAAELWRVFFVFVLDGDLRIMKTSYVYVGLPAAEASYSLLPAKASNALLVVAGTQRQTWLQSTEERVYAGRGAQNGTLQENTTVITAQDIRYEYKVACVYAFGEQHVASSTLGPFDNVSTVDIDVSGDCATVTVRSGPIASVFLIRISTCELSHAGSCVDDWKPEANTELVHKDQTYQISAPMMHYQRALRLPFVVASSVIGPVFTVYTIFLNYSLPASTGIAVLCPAGFAKNITTGRCNLCLANHYCMHGQHHACPLHSQTSRGARSRSACSCIGGYYQSSITSGCVDVGRGFYSQNGIRFSCGRHSTTVFANSSEESACLCTAGFSRQNAECVLLCDAPRTAAGPGACACPVGHYYNHSRNECVRCESGSVCLMGGSEPGEKCGENGDLKILDADGQRCVCRPGYYVPSPAGVQLRAHTQCQPCPVGFYCNEPANLALRKCPAGQNSSNLASQKSECFCIRRGEVSQDIAPSGRECVCNMYYYRNFSQCVPCPANSRSIQMNAEVALECACDEGYYREEGSAECLGCPQGHYCLRSSKIPCPAGTFGPARLQGRDGPASCMQCPGEALTSPGAMHASACASVLLPVAVPMAIRLHKSVSVMVTFRSRALNATLPANIRSEMLTRLQDHIGSSDVNVLQVTRGSPFTSVQFETTDAAMQHIMQQLTQESVVWEQVRALTSAGRSDMYELVTHAIFCNLMGANMFGTYMLSAGVRFDVLCYSSGIIVPVDLHRENAMRLAAQWLSLRVRGFASRKGLDHILWSSTPPLLETLKVLAVNMVFTASQQRVWPSTNDLLSSAAIHSMYLDRGILTVAIMGASHLDARWARNAPGMALRADFMRMQSDVFCRDCAHTIRQLSGDCAQDTADPAVGDARCAFCKSGIEFWDADSERCVRCSSGTCDTSKTVALLEPCCKSNNTRCIAAVTRSGGLCNNGVHDVTEECDASADTALSQCCTSDCKLRPGFYASPPCMTFCGDGVVAQGVEECEPSEPLAQGRCSMLNCKITMSL